MKKLIIFDIDGTLADQDHRQHFVKNKPKDWKQYFDNIHLDTPKKDTFLMLKLLAESGQFTIECWTGRDESLREKTVQWLKDHQIYQYISKIQMRPVNNKIKDDILKKEWAKKVGVENIFLVFEDRDRVVKMWRSLKVNCFQVADGDF